MKEVYWASAAFIMAFSLVFGATLNAWAADKPVELKVECPAGAELKGAAPPAGFEQWCEKGGERHGPSAQWHDSGKPAGLSHFDDGRPAGKTVAWYENGQQLSEGNFQGGGEHGGHQYAGGQ